MDKSYYVIADYGRSDDDRADGPMKADEVVNTSSIVVRVAERERTALFGRLIVAEYGDVIRVVGRGVSFTIICCKGD